jgi:hypothetical protein
MVMEIPMRFLIVVFTLLFLSACALTNINSNYAQTVSSWRWTSANSLLRSWGKPSKIGSLPNGNQVYIYHKESYKNYPTRPATPNYATVSVATGRSFIVVPATNQPPEASSYLLECTTIFEVDPRRIIVDVRATGNNCTGDDGFMLSRSNPHPVASGTKPQQRKNSND